MPTFRTSIPSCGRRIGGFYACRQDAAAHSSRILRADLGLSEEEIQDLHERGVVASAPISDNEGGTMGRLAQTEGLTDIQRQVIDAMRESCWTGRSSRMPSS
jgi:hypothetical protein